MKMSDGKRHKFVAFPVPFLLCVTQVLSGKTKRDKK